MDRLFPAGGFATLANSKREKPRSSIPIGRFSDADLATLAMFPSPSYRYLFQYSLRRELGSSAQDRGEPLTPYKSNT